MKRLSKIFTWLTLLLFLAIDLSAQTDSLPVSTDFSLDLLRAPVSPAANLLGISPSQVDKPSDPAAFMASINAASNQFTGLPSSYAVDLAPVWLLAGRKIRLEDYLSGSPGKSLPQSFVVSLATHTVPGISDSLPDVTKLAAGIKFSVFRGQVSQETMQLMDELSRQLRNLSVRFDKALDSLKALDHRYRFLDSLVFSIITNPDFSFEEKEALTKSVREQMAIRQDSLAGWIRHNIAVNEFESAKKAAENVRFTRYGYKLDLSAVLSWDFPGLSFDRRKFSTFAAWVSGGYECPNGLSYLALIRFLNFSGLPLHNDQQLILYKDSQALDAGFRFIYSSPASRFGAGAEAVYRKLMNLDEVDPSWRITVNAEYDVGRNKKLSVIVGRDFDGILTGEGDLILALNFLMGFGTDKKL